MNQKIIDFVRKVNSIGLVMKHIHNTDVAFFATNADETHAEDINTPVIHIYGHWINIASLSKYMIDSEWISINPNDLDSWVEIEDPRS